VLPEGWVNYSATPTPLAPRGQYGAHFWLNAGSASNPADRVWPRLPSDAFFADGYQGQRVVIIPSRKLVVVRFGLTPKPADMEFEAFLGMSWRPFLVKKKYFSPQTGIIGEDLRKEERMENTAIPLHETLMKYGRLATFPVGVKLAKKGDQAPEKMRYPLKDLGHRLTVCQGMTAAVPWVGP